MDKVSLNGVELYPFYSNEQLLHYIEVHKGILVAINVDKILHATEQTRAIINKHIGYCDGAGAMLALRQKGYKDVCKIPGCELWLKIVCHFYAQKTFYLIGAKSQVIKETVIRLRNEFENIRIVGYRDGYIKTEEENKLIADIIVQKPDVVFVAMGSPKQEILMEKMYERHPAIYQGLGGSFDIYTGRVKRAPKWWIEHNLEGAYRLIIQPFKIKRFIRALPFWWNLYLNKY